MSHIIRASRDPSCLLCLTPHGGGSWWSPIRIGKFTNFAKSAHEWHSFQEFVKKHIYSISDNYTFECKFEITQLIPAVASLFAIESGENSVVNIVLQEDRSVTVSSALITDVVSSSLTLDPDVEHTLSIMYAVGLFMVVIDGITVVEIGAMGNNSFDPDTMGVPVSDCCLFSELKFYTAYWIGTEQRHYIWDAVKEIQNEEILRGEPWNYQQAAKQFNDQLEACRLDDFFEREIKYEIVFENHVEYPSDPDCFIFGTGWQVASANTERNSMFGVRWFNDGTIEVTSNMFQGVNVYSGVSLTLQQAGVPLSIGEHKITFTTSGNQLIVQLDDQTPRTVTATARQTSLDNIHPPICTAEVTLISVTQTDLTNDKVMWKFPTVGERNFMFYKHNMSTQNGYFENNYTIELTNGIETALDLRGETGSYTVVLAFLTNDRAAPDTYTEALCGQGSVTSIERPSLLGMRHVKSGPTTYRMDFSHEVGGIQRLVSSDNVEYDYSGVTVAIGVVRVNDDNTTTLEVYFKRDGVISARGDSTFPGTPKGISLNKFFSIGRSDVAGDTKVEGFEYVCVFSRALAVNEMSIFK